VLKLRARLLFQQNVPQEIEKMKIKKDFDTMLKYFIIDIVNYAFDLKPIYVMVCFCFIHEEINNT